MAPPAHHAHWSREEAAMAAITFNTVQKEQVPDQLKMVLTVFRDMLDAVVSNWMREVAAEAGHLRPRYTQTPSRHAP
jgi:hypothetical protein